MKPIHALTCFFALALTPAVSLAETAMTAQEFDNYTRGKTLFYGQNGAAYGAEIYMDNRRVRWSFLDGECKEGEWYESADQICFVYEDNPDPQCWTFHRDGSGLIARFENTPGATELYEADDLGAEMVCLAPNTGV
ncbi:hypothetical protein KX928_20785 [Roseobacter sp. YSTF-M11]|uniref:DUF995 domain-containing protein n=1 Tax=Roseobacter insulae TaxID=2859783 RepID=A0A9X1FZ44_9RHOB|nr:hypothetical protein [Roseobacter insulae]MBW4710231.1 hypothetical protein [Roseobacter insulae]